MFELSEGTQILRADEIDLPTGEFSRIQFVTACFAPGGTPKDWLPFEENESNWASLTPEVQTRMVEQLKGAICGGKVREISLSFEPWGEDHFLSAEFDQGWAAILYNACDECGVALYSDRPDGLEDAPVDIGGQTPVPKMCAIEDLEKAARAVSCFLETGRLSPETTWAVNLEGDLPWRF
ncbi:MAG: hypothetical protein HFF50_06860 [Lawsonibacter sp.]|nr:hypothetical protein [Lawsonibacter sp.]